MTGLVLSREDALAEADTVVPQILETFFLPGELITTSISIPDDEGVDPPVYLTVTTSTDDVQQFYVWQPGVPSLTTREGIHTNLVAQLEDWFPTSSLGWGIQRQYT